MREALMYLPPASSRTSLHRGVGNARHCLRISWREQAIVYHALSLSISFCSWPGCHSAHPAKKRSSDALICPRLTASVALCNPPRKTPGTTSLAPSSRCPCSTCTICWLTGPPLYRTASPKRSATSENDTTSFIVYWVGRLSTRPQLPPSSCFTMKTTVCQNRTSFMAPISPAATTSPPFSGLGHSCAHASSVASLGFCSRSRARLFTATRDVRPFCSLYHSVSRTLTPSDGERRSSS
mmetsp:Transcript_9430/g.34619  ORF Transcript_9430/g.34619 Transcript_9430/m.34619 type:complete len:238 (+) Transcript_9430:161-874(+)